MSNEEQTESPRVTKRGTFIKTNESDDRFLCCECIWHGKNTRCSGYYLMGGKK